MLEGLLVGDELGADDGETLGVADGYSQESENSTHPSIASKKMPSHVFGLYFTSLQP